MDRLARQTIAPDSAVLRVAMVERPLGDEFINGKLWEHVDELSIDEDCRERMGANGFRVGVLIGAPSTELQQLLVSRLFCAAKDSAFQTSKTLPIPLGPILPRTAFFVTQDKTPAEITLSDARYCLDVSARFVGDGTRLTFTPRVEHGGPRLPFEASADRRHWEMCTERACHKYPELSWEVTLGPNQYLFVGARPDRERSIGQNAFTESDLPQPTQRLLVIVNCRAIAPSDGGSDDPGAVAEITPLALQAAAAASGRR